MSHHFGSKQGIEIFSNFSNRFKFFEQAMLFYRENFDSLSVYVTHWTVSHQNKCVTSVGNINSYLYYTYHALTRGM